MVGGRVHRAFRYEGDVAVGLERVADVGCGIAAEAGGGEDVVDGNVGGQVVWVELFPLPLAGGGVEQNASGEGKVAAVARTTAVRRKVKRAIRPNGKARKAAADAVIISGVCRRVCAAAARPMRSIEPFLPQGIERIVARILGDANRASGDVEDAANFDVVAGGLRIGIGGGAKGGERDEHEATSKHWVLSERAGQV